MTSTRLLPGAPCLVLLLAACGGSGPQPVSGCETDPECGAGAYCAQGTCRASSAPVADFTFPSPLVSSRALAFQAAVTDPDAGDSVERHDWAVTRVTGTCDAESTPAGATLEVIFWCSGTYDVTLVATDRHGVSSAPATRRLEVSQSPSLPTVTASSVSPGVGHRCTGVPLACSLNASIGLRAAASDPAAQPLAFSWRARPSNPRVTAATATFAPSENASDPAVTIGTDGGALAGDWSFEVRVKNGDGFLARSTVVVRVENRPPAVVATPLAVDHAYLAGAFVASGTLTPAATDPDGDPVEFAIGYVEPAGSGCTASFDAPAAAFSVSCVRAASLIGEVSREAVVTATDVNGDATEVSVAIEIRNRPPTIRLAAGSAASELAVEHGVGACLAGVGTCYRVDGVQPFAADDPDGDPLADVSLTAVVGPLGLHSTGQVGGGVPASFRFSTPLAFPAEFRSAEGASPFLVHGVALDPFGASATAEVPLRVGNRPPVPKATVPFAFSNHTYAAVPGEYLATFELAAFEDPDGDPITTGGEPGSADCADFGASATTGAVTVTCRKPYVVGTPALPPLASFLGTRPVVALAQDAWATGSAASSITIGNRPTTMISSTGPVTARCDFICPFPTFQVGAGTRSLAVWASTISAPVGTGPAACPDPLEFLPVEMGIDPGVADPDGDPLLLTYRGPVATITKTAVPAKAGLATTDTFASTWNVTADDGGGGPAATATVVITDVGCL